jgi:hypothetical protein
MPTHARVIWFTSICTLVVVCAGCGKREPPKPDGSSGLRGQCWIIVSELEPTRRPWTTATVSATRANNSKDVTQSKVDSDGKFRLVVVPGEDYLISVSAPGWNDEMWFPHLVKVPSTGYVEVTIEHPGLLTAVQPSVR